MFTIRTFLKDDNHLCKWHIRKTGFINVIAGFTFTPCLKEYFSEKNFF